MTWRNAAIGTTKAAAPELAAHYEWLSTTQAASRLGITDRGVRSAIATGRLHAESIAGRWRISREALQHFRQGHTTETRTDTN
ncbi:helix-turn-helix domain-containing protein [Cryobacterium zongtaii]